MPFQNIIAVEFSDVRKGLILPEIFTSMMEFNTNFVILEDYKGDVYVVRVKITDTNMFKLAGTIWKEFIDANLEEGLNTLHFIMIGHNSWKVNVFNKHGLSFGYDQNAEHSILSSLVKVTPDSFISQDIPFEFMYQIGILLNRPRQQHMVIDTLNGLYKADVVCRSHPNPSTAIKSAIRGQVWEDITTLNRMVVGQTLILSRSVNNQVKISLFNQYGVYLNNQGGYYLHSCSMFHHPHRNFDRVFYMPVDNNVIINGFLVVPKDFAEMFVIRNFTRAVLWFKTMAFHMEITMSEADDLESDQQNVILKGDWENMIDRIGFFEGKVVRFEFRVMHTLNPNVVFLIFAKDICPGA